MKVLSVTLLIGLLAGLLVTSVCFNVFLYKNFAPQFREHVFIEKNWNHLSTIIFEGGSVIDGVILEENDETVTIRFFDGTTDFKKSEISHIVRDSYKDYKQKQVPGR